MRPLWQASAQGASSSCTSPSAGTRQFVSGALSAHETRTPKKESKSVSDPKLLFEQVDIFIDVVGWSPKDVP